MPRIAPQKVLARKLNSLVTRSGRSITAVAQAIGIYRANLSEILSGQTDPRISTVARILAELGASWSDLD